MTNTITKNEQSLLIAIRDSEFHDGNNPVENYVWTDCLHGWSNTKKFPGTMASLVKKGLVKTNGETCTLTEAGWEILH